MHGSISVRVYYQSNEVVCIIEDTGVGIPQEGMFWLCFLIFMWTRTQPVPYLQMSTKSLNDFIVYRCVVLMKFQKYL